MRARRHPQAAAKLGHAAIEPFLGIVALDSCLSVTVPRSLLTVFLSSAYGELIRLRTRFQRLHSRDLLDLRRAESGGPRMQKIDSLVGAYLTAERELVAAVDSAGGALPLPDGRTVTVGRA
jgi:hypothetical protein